MVIRFALALIFSLMTLSATANAVQMVVVTSTSPSVVLGTVLNEGEVLKISAGELVKLVSENGEIVRITGPFMGSPNFKEHMNKQPSTTNLIAYLKAMFENRKLDDSSSASIRTGRVLMAPNLWWVNILASGKHCVGTEEKVLIWRSVAKKQAEVLVKKSGGNTIKSLWFAGASTTVWPKIMPLENGVWYSLITSHPKKANMVQIRLLPRDLPTDAHRAVWMAKNGCKRQAMRLLEEM
jgi:hypothetical protein